MSKNKPTRADATAEAAKIAAKLGQAVRAGDLEKAAELADQAQLAHRLLYSEK